MILTYNIRSEGKRPPSFFTEQGIYCYCPLKYEKSYMKLE